MKTDKKVMAEVLRNIADNLDSGLDKNDSIQVRYGDNEWEDRTTNNLCFDENVLYRIKPQTITLRNGVTIPKPLDIKKLDVNTNYYTPLLCTDLYYEIIGFDFRSMGIKLAYSKKEEAIEASKKLFGIED